MESEIKMPDFRRFTQRKFIATFCSVVFAFFSASLAVVPSASAESPQVNLSPQTGLREGQVVTVTWSGFAPYQLIAIRQCVNNATESSQCSSGAGGLVQEMSSASGSGLAYFQVVSTEGTINTSLPGANGTSCGPSSPCDVVLTNLEDLGKPNLGFVFPITFKPEATSCPTENMNNITGGGSGALSAIMPNWQIALCKSSNRVTVDYLATRGDEGGMQDFNCGLIDFAVTEVADEHGGKCLMTDKVRSAVYVPIANSALVFAYSMRNRLDQQRLPEINLTADMLAHTMTGQALSWGSHAATSTKNVAIYALNNSRSPRVTNASGDGTKITFAANGIFNVGDSVIVEDVNPSGYNSEYEITSVTNADDSDPTKGQTSFTVDGSYKRAYVSGGLVNPTNQLPGSISVYGRADASGLNFLMTRYFLEKAAEAFHAPGGQFSEEGFPAPSLYMPLANSLDPGAFRSNSDAVVAAMRGSDDPTGGVGFIAPMDAAIAKFSGFPSVSIANSDGSKFIAPTTESIGLGISEMITDEKTGVASANLNPVNPNAYPLVFTVYAMVPTETETQKAADALKAMLAHIRDNSKSSDVPSGFVALTDAQKQQISGAIAKIAGPEPSPSATPSSSATPEPNNSEIPVIDPVDTDGGDGTGIISIDSGITNVGGGATVLKKLPSIFAAPFVPHNGLAAGVIPALVLIGAAASVTSLVRKPSESSG